MDVAPARAATLAKNKKPTAFFYNAIFFSYALVLGRFFNIAEHRIGLYILPFAAGNYLGPLLLGRLAAERRSLEHVARPLSSAD